MYCNNFSVINIMIKTNKKSRSMSILLLNVSSLCDLYQGTSCVLLQRPNQRPPKKVERKFSYDRLTNVTDAAILFLTNNCLFTFQRQKFFEILLPESVCFLLFYFFIITPPFPQHYRALQLPYF